MMKLPKIGNSNIPLRFTLPVAFFSILSVALFEGRGLDTLDHPKPVEISCLSCHSDKKTLKAMADKAGDPLYLVHSGELTAAELKRLTEKWAWPAVKTAPDKTERPPARTSPHPGPLPSFGRGR